ncbi:MAG: hypothetical protein ACPGOY_12470 [Rhodospirillaceae bacterium]
MNLTSTHTVKLSALHYALVSQCDCPIGRQQVARMAAQHPPIAETLQSLLELGLLCKRPAYSPARVTIAPLDQVLASTTITRDVLPRPMTLSSPTPSPVMGARHG